MATVKAIVAIWAIVGGLAAGLVVHFKVSPEIREKIERRCMNFIIAVPFWVLAAVNSGNASVSAADAVVAMGLIVEFHWLRASSCMSREGARLVSNNAFERTGNHRGRAVLAMD